MTVLEEAQELAKLFLKHLPEVREMLELAGEFSVRKGRDAKAGDLKDSLAKLRTLDRTDG